MLEGEGLFVEIVAPRLWEDPHTLDGAFTSNSPADRKYAIDRSKRAVDIANLMGTSKASVSRLHKRALERLRLDNQLNDGEGFLAV